VSRARDECSRPVRPFSESLGWQAQVSEGTFPAAGMQFWNLSIPVVLP
jgi:hypothetical protein